MTGSVVWSISTSMTGQVIVVDISRQFQLSITKDTLVEDHIMLMRLKH